MDLQATLAININSLFRNNFCCVSRKDQLDLYSLSFAKGSIG